MEIFFCSRVKAKFTSSRMCIDTNKSVSVYTYTNFGGGAFATVEHSSNQVDCHLY